MLGPQTTLLDAFKSANQVLQGAVQGIAELITRPGLINVDFADVRTVMAETGMAMMGSGSASGENRAREAAEAAVSSPLLEDINLAGAHGILVNVTAGMDLSIGEFQEVGNIVKQFASEDATVVVGTVIDPELTNMVRVTVVATGLGRPAAAARPSLSQARERETVQLGTATHIVRHRRAASPRCGSFVARRCRIAITRLSTSLRFRGSAPWVTDCGRRRIPRTCWTSRRSCGVRPTDLEGLYRGAKPLFGLGGTMEWCFGL